ncbi:MAG: MFS transporter [Chloroflexota bacterium]
MSPRIATFLIFVVNGAMVGTWLANIPWISGHLDASRTQIGVVLLCTAAGALVAMTITGQLLTRVSTRRMVIVSSLLLPLLAPVPLLAPSLGALAAVMVVFGFVNGVMDVSMNAHGVALERRTGRPIISSLHAGWSVGGLLGAACVALAAAAKVEPAVEAAIAGAALIGVTLVAIPFLGRATIEGEPRPEGGSRLTLPSRAVLPLGVLAVLAAVVEGGIGDWAGLYLQRDLGVEAGIAALAYTAFALGLTGGRLTGDWMNRRYGAGRLLQAGMAVVAVAVGVVLFASSPALALPGLVVAGIGVANAIPLVFSAGGHIPPSGPSLAAVFTMTYTAFLAGPPILGFIADHIGLPATFGLIVVAAVVGAVVAPRTPGIDAANQLAAGAATGEQPATA